MAAAVDLRKQVRDSRRLTGYPSAVITQAEAARILNASEEDAPAVVADIIRSLVARRPNDPKLRQWLDYHHLDYHIDDLQDAAPAPVPAPADPAADAPADPRTHQHWGLLLNTARAMGIDLQAAMDYYVDEYRTQIDRLTAQLEQAKRRGIPTYEADDDWGVPPTYEPGETVLDALWYIEHDRPVILVGPAGSGKTVGLRWCCKRLKRKMRVISMHSHVMADALEGYSWIGVREYQDEHGRVANAVPVMEWAAGALMLAMQEGAVLVVDELDRAPTAIQHMLNDVAQSRSMTFRDGAHAGETVHAQPGFLIVGTANTLNGTDNGFISNQIDKSTLSRFRVLLVDYDTDAERKLLNRLGVNPDLADRIMNAIAEARREASQNHLTTPPGTRHLEHLAQDIVDGMDPAKAWRYNISDMQTENTGHPHYRTAERIGEMLTAC